ncbi:lipopolysaccharide biosynthesis protein [Sandarakinorhabdus sp.]|uniref:lipopolysaccharide biosynthesis protein n=1 Tax=Sandarakinorhabdus sp. TaxID=1916663 RepID=UPI003340A4F1
MTEPANEPTGAGAKKAPDDLGRHAIPGVITTVLSRGGRAIIGVGTLAVLSRYLTPGEFGVFALVLFFVSFAQYVGEAGIRAALIMRQNTTQLEEDSAFWFSVAIGIAMTALTILCAEPIARLFNEPDLPGPLRTAAWLFLVYSVRSVAYVHLERQFKFHLLSFAEIVGALCGGAIAIVLALQGAGAMALVAQFLLLGFVNTALIVWASDYRPRLQYSFSAVRPLLGIGASVTTAAMVDFLASTIERPIVGVKLSGAELGTLSVAQQAASIPLRLIATNIARVSFPILASIQDDMKRLAAAHISALHAGMVIMGAVCFGLAAVAHPMVRVLLGPQWAQAGDVFAVIAITAGLGTLIELNQAVFSAKKKVNFLLYWSLYSLLANALIAWIVAPFGLMPVVLGRLGFVLVSTPISCFFAAKLLECRTIDILGGVVRPLLASMLMGAAVYGVDQMWLADLASPVLRLAALIPVGVLVFAIAIWIVDGAKVRDLLARLRNMRKKRAA